MAAIGILSALYTAEATGIAAIRKKACCCCCAKSETVVYFSVLYLLLHLITYSFRKKILLFYVQ